MEMSLRFEATCLLCCSFLLLITSSDGRTGLGKGFGDHIHWRTLEDGKKEAAARSVYNNSEHKTWGRKQRPRTSFTWIGLFSLYSL